MKLTEAASAQGPLIQHAVSMGWEILAPAEALQKRGGEAGLFFYRELQESLLRLNPGLVTPENVGGIIQRMESVPSTIEGNREILEWVRGHRAVYCEAEKRHRNVAVVDFADLTKNRFQVTSEWTFRAGNRKANRADVVFLINGVPVAIVETKNPKLSDAMERAVKQLRRYEIETPELVTAPQVFNITHLLEYFYGVTWNYSRKGIFNWKEEAVIIPFPGQVKADSAEPMLKVAETPVAYGGTDVPFKNHVQSFFDRNRFLAMLQDWILFFFKDDELQKTVLRQHQTRAVEKVVNRCADPQRKTGLVWHTQGSGKTFTLITAARIILEDRKRFPGATVMLVVDRNELEGQLSGWVEKLVGESGQIKIEYAVSRAKLQQLLDQDFRGMIVSMIHKFDEIRKDSCIRSDFFVLIDEAHRSTGGDLGNFLMAALPKATLIGFTGTPIDKTAYGKGTFKVFGKEDDKGYLDKYSIAESIADGTTVKLHLALAPNTMRLPEELLEKEFLGIVESEGVSDVEELNRILDRAVNLKAFLKADDRIDKVAQFIAQHFKQNVEPLGYKAFLVAVDREACARYKEALDRYLPPEYSLPIYTKNASDSLDRPVVATHQVNEVEEKKARKAFPKANQNPKIFIVTDKLLTGYDAPILYCMYLDKPMRDHVLLQAVARVNRPYEDERGVKKPCGLIVDFVGILKELNKALAFDSDIVNAVIDDLDVLYARFSELMQSKGRSYLDQFKGLSDELLVERLCTVFLDKGRRHEFTDFFKEIETLYEILSPSPDLRDYIHPYSRLAEFYLVIRNKFGRKTSFWEEIAHKTEALVRENAEIQGLTQLTKTVEFDARTLEALKRKQGSDDAKVVNLVKSLETSAADRGEKEPYLIPIAERAAAVMEALEERQISTQEAMGHLEQLLRERLEAEKARSESGLDANTFEIFWMLKQEKLDDPKLLAEEISSVFQRFPNYRTNADELRQLKAEIYKTLLRVVNGKRMVDLAEQILRLTRQ
jgi:type I restriction enzyme R subunit